MSEDLTGKKNIYKCQGCFYETVTVHADHGVTPFMTVCPFCKKAMAQSALYRVDQSLPATHEWFKPESVEGLSPGYRRHVEQGGLLLREIEG